MEKDNERIEALTDEILKSLLDELLKRIKESGLIQKFIKEILEGIKAEVGLMEKRVGEMLVQLEQAQSACSLNNIPRAESQKKEAESENNSSDGLKKKFLLLLKALADKPGADLIFLLLLTFPSFATTHIMSQKLITLVSDVSSPTGLIEQIRWNLAGILAKQKKKKISLIEKNKISTKGKTHDEPRPGVEYRLTNEEGRKYALARLRLHPLWDPEIEETIKELLIVK